MKRIFKLSLCIIITCLTWNCDKDDAAIPENELSVQLKNTETYNYDLHISGDEEGAAIIMQAQHYEVSELIRNSSTNWSIVYRYKPEENYTGNDHVGIETCTGGQSVTCTNIDTIRINFTVTD